MNKRLDYLEQFVARNERRLVFGLIALMILGGLVYSLRLGDTFRFIDERVYYTLATNLVQHQAYSLDGTTPTAIK